MKANRERIEGSADRERIEGIARCFAAALIETLRCGDDYTRDTGNAIEGWVNLSGKVIEFAESDTE